MAASGVNIKMGVSGIAQFKQNINQAKQSLKTLDEQLKLNEKEFKANGDAQAYMEKKSEILKVKLEEQKAVLANAEKALDDMSKRGVDKASKAFQDMQRQVLQARGNLLDTQNALDNVAESGDAASDSVSEMNSQLANVGKQVSVENVVNGLDRITGGMEKAAKKAADLGKKIMTQVLGVGTWADDINTRAAVLGVSPEDLQRMEKTATLIDTPVETIIAARKKLAKELEGQGKNDMGAWAALGIDPTKTTDAEDLLWQTGQALMNLGDSTKQEYYAQELLGRSWGELVPLFKAGREEYEKTNKSWNVMSEEQLKQLNEMDDEYQKLQIAVQDLKREALSNLAEPMKAALEAVNGLLGDIGKWLQSDEGKATVENVVTKITDAMKWVVKNKETVITALSGIVAGWAALKLTGGALRVYQMIEGLKGLGMFGGVGAKAAATAGVSGVSAGTGVTAGSVLGKIGSGLTGGALTPLAIAGIAVAPAMLAQRADERRWAEEQQKRLETAEKLTGGDAAFMRGSADVMGQIHQWTDDPFKLLMGLQSRGAIEKAQLFNRLVGQYSMGNYATNELLDLWKTGGEGWDQARLVSLLDVVSASYERMAEQTSDVTGATEDQTKASKDMTDAAKELQKIPGEIAKSINGMNVVMDGQTVGNVMLPYINSGLATQIP